MDQVTWLVELELIPAHWHHGTKRTTCHTTIPRCGGVRFVNCSSWNSKHGALQNLPFEGWVFLPEKKSRVTDCDLSPSSRQASMSFQKGATETRVLPKASWWDWNSPLKQAIKLGKKIIPKGFCSIPRGKECYTEEATKNLSRQALLGSPWSIANHSSKQLSILPQI